MADAARSGLGWMSAERAVSQVIQLAASIALARLLVPDDFGLIAIAVAIGGLARAVGDFGVSTLVVQRKSLDSEFLRAAFTVSSAVFLGLAVVQVLLAPLGGLVMGDQRVVGVVAALAFALPLQGLASLFQALLRRDLAFSKIVKLNLLAVVVSSVVACFLAAKGFGVWSLVAAQIAAPASVASVAWKMTSVKMSFDLSAARQWSREIVSFGKFATGNSIINYLVQNMDYLLIGRLLPTAQLGFYYFAFERSRFLSRRVLDLYSSLALPVFSRLNQDSERIRRAYQVATTVALLVIAPLVTFLAFQARLVIPLVFGERWVPSVVVFQILSIHVIVNAVTSGIGSVLYAVGRPDISFRIVRWIVVPLGISYFAGARLAGIVGVAIAVALVKSVFSLIKLGVCFRFLRWQWLPTLRPALVVIAGAGVAGLASLGFQGLIPPESGWIRLLFTAVVYCLVFGLSQVTVNRSGLEKTWQGVLGSAGIEWCEARLPWSVRRLLAVPDGGR